MGMLSQLHGTKPNRALVHPHGHHGDLGQLHPAPTPAHHRGRPHISAQAGSESWWDSGGRLVLPQSRKLELLAGGHRGGQLQFNSLSPQSPLLGAPV